MAQACARDLLIQINQFCPLYPKRTEVTQKDCIVYDRIYYFRVFLGKPVKLCLIGHKRHHPLTLIRYRPNLTLPYSVLTSEVMSVVTPSHTKTKTPHTRQTLRKSTFIECYATTLPSITTHSISIRFGFRIRRQLFLCLNGKTG